jgi:acyl-coenzyme A synthetase/AMP-(fatty) acid ligase
MALNYIDLFDRAVTMSRDRLALADERDRFTFGQLQVLTYRLANTWRSEGARRSAPFAVLSPNTTLAMVAILGGLRAGGRGATSTCATRWR